LQLSKELRNIMYRRSRLVVGALVAAFFMALMVGTASARRFEVSSQAFRAVWRPLIFGDNAGVNVSCPVTLEGSFHSRTTSKVSGQLIGYITRGIVGPPETCENGEATVNTETLPWHIQYNTFEGRLPQISGVNLTLVGAKFEVRGGGVLCTSQTTQSSPAWGRVLVNTTTGRVEGLRALEEHKIALGGGFFCGLSSPGFFAGTATVTVQNSTTAITVRLVQ
jgi:hypothetical protein